MSEKDGKKDRPTHSIEPADGQGPDRKPGRHEVDAPDARTDDEVTSDEDKTTQRQE